MANLVAYLVAKPVLFANCANVGIRRDCCGKTKTLYVDCIR